jgi:ribosomal protein L37E
MLGTVSRAHVYEVRCERCQCSFAPETRRCVHCGGPLGRRAQRLEPGVLVGRERAGPDEPEPEDMELARRVRNRIWVATAVLAVIASLARTCTS